MKKTILLPKIHNTKVTHKKNTSSNALSISSANAVKRGRINEIIANQNKLINFMPCLV